MTDTPVLTAPAPRLGPYALARLNRPPRRRPPGHLLVLPTYLAISLVIFGHLVRHLNEASLRVRPTDQYAVEWYLWHAPYSLLHGQNPLFTPLWNPPLGANLMANPSVLGIGLPLLPLTVLAGPRVTLAVALVLGLAGSAAAWYWLFRRLVPGSRLAAAFAGGFCGFCPAAVSHADGAQLNLLLTVLVPFIIANALRLAEPNRLLRNGVPLGLLVAYQAFIGEGLLLLTALGLALFGLCYLLCRPRAALRAAPRMALGLLVAAAVAVPLLAYPLWWQFTGPQSYSGLPAAARAANDIAGIGLLPSQSLFGDQASTGAYVPHHAEENAFFGVPLLLLVAVCIVRLRREIGARLAAVAIPVACLLSMGAVVRFRGHDLVPGPWVALRHLPLLNTLVASRLAIIAVPFIGLVLALATARLVGVPAPDLAGPDDTQRLDRVLDDTQRLDPVPADPDPTGAGQADPDPTGAGRAGPVSTDAARAQPVPARMARPEQTVAVHPNGSDPVTFAPRARPNPDARRPRRFALLAIVLALLTVAPGPLPVSGRPPVPRFITSGAWRQSIAPGSVVMTVPLTMSPSGVDTIEWQIRTDGGFALVGGYFLGPHDADRMGYPSPAGTPTQRMLNRVWYTGKVPIIGDSARAQARADLTRLRVDAIVVADRGFRAASVHALELLLQVPATHVMDVWLWHIHDGAAVPPAR